MFYWLLSAFLGIATFLQGNPAELGDVQWLRSLEEAQKESTQSGKPILILFQEVPGCATCRNYGSDVLTDPLVVETIETHFVPLAIYNNRKGADAQALRIFKEPAWNNPVVRVVNHDLEEILPRLNADYSKPGLTNYLTRALIRKYGKAPGWLHLVNDAWNASPSNTETAVYSMYCFWSGEAHFGKLNGVLSTEPGFSGGKEVVKVTYDSSIITKKQLDAYAKTTSCRVISPGEGYRPDSNPQYYLSNSPYAKVEMTSIQRTRVNSALGEGQDPSGYLSPGQLKKMEK